MKNAIYLVALANSGAMLHDLGRSYWLMDQSEAEQLADDLNERNGFDPDGEDGEDFWEVVSIEHGSTMQELLFSREEEGEGEASNP